VDPVLGREVVEREQSVLVVGDLGDRLGPLGAELVGERSDRLLRCILVLGVGDLEDGAPRRGLHRLRHAVESVRCLVHPVPLRAGLGEDVSHGGPESERAVADRHYRSAHPAALQAS
jgi:hypothetical protein